MQILEQLACGYDMNITTESIVVECASVNGYLECMMEMSDAEVVTEGIDIKELGRKFLSFIKKIVEKIKSLIKKFVRFIAGKKKSQDDINKSIEKSLSDLKSSGAFTDEPVSPETERKVKDEYMSHGEGERKFTKRQPTNADKPHVSNNYLLRNEQTPIPRIGKMTMREITEMIVNGMDYNGPTYRGITLGITRLVVIADYMSTQCRSSYEYLIDKFVDVDWDESLKDIRRLSEDIINTNSNVNGYLEDMIEQCGMLMRIYDQFGLPISVRPKDLSDLERAVNLSLKHLGLFVDFAYDDAIKGNYNITIGKDIFSQIKDDVYSDCAFDLHEVNITDFKKQRTSNHNMIYTIIKEFEAYANDLMTISGKVEKSLDKITDKYNTTHIHREGSDEIYYKCSEYMSTIIAELNRDFRIVNSYILMLSNVLDRAGEDMRKYELFIKEVSRRLDSYLK